MRISFPNLLLLPAIITLADARPFLPNPRGDRLARRQATYSVVPVDGGSTAAPAVSTVTEPPSTLPAVTETKLSTLLSTIVVTEYERPSTIVITVTSTPLRPSSGIASNEATQTPSCSEYTTTITTAIPTAQATTTKHSTAPAAAVSRTTLSPEVVTVTASPSRTPYDDGMWHTTYYHPLDEISSSSSSAY